MTATPALDDLMKHYREVLTNMRGDIEGFESWGMKIYHSEVDVTEATVKDFKRRADNLERRIAAYEREL
jgi:hypothetical protein